MAALDGLPDDVGSGVSGAAENGDASHELSFRALLRAPRSMRDGDGVAPCPQPALWTSSLTVGNLVSNGK
ncbi:hypothetical protein GCM10009590_30930 [Brachybacterium alimentarium]